MDLISDNAERQQVVISILLGTCKYALPTRANCFDQPGDVEMADYTQDSLQAEVREKKAGRPQTQLQQWLKRLGIEPRNIFRTWVLLCVSVFLLQDLQFAHAAPESPGSGGTPLLAGGFAHTCEIRYGALYCWGNNQYGQLGIGNTANQSTPVAVPGMSSGVTAVSLGQQNTCAIKDGGLWCWGLNNNGQLGDGSTTNRLSVLLTFSVYTLEIRLDGLNRSSTHVPIPLMRSLRVVIHQPPLQVRL